MPPDIEERDPFEVEERRRSIYVSKRDLVWALVAAGMIITVFALLYSHFKREAEKTVCRRNLKHIGESLNLYLFDNNDRYPPAFAANEAGHVALEGGLPVTWVSLLFENLNRRATFVCPTADPSEYSHNDRPASTASIPSTYGFYMARGFYEQSRLAYPGESAVIAETSNRGAMGTFDPEPLTDADGRTLPNDGFLIGWDDGNMAASPASRLVTRLAFSGTAGGNFAEDRRSRHGEGIHVLRADGGVSIVKPPGARISRLASQIVGLWALR
jgi:hypothetical protein